MTSTAGVLERPRTEDAKPALRSLAKAAVAGLLVLAVFAHIMTFPLGHDEQIHVTAGRFFLEEPLYGVLGYNHLPGLPMLLSSIYILTGNHFLLLAGRLLIFVCWIAIAMTFRAIARANGGNDDIGFLAMLVFMAGAPLGPTGMLVTNNLLPIPFALLGLHLFLSGMRRADGAPRIFAAGVALGFGVMLKISYAFVIPPFVLAAMLARNDIALRRRIAKVILPLLAGGTVGCSPALVVIATGPGMLYAHTVRYFTAGHLAFWQHSTGPKAMTPVAKAAIASDVWLAGSGLLGAVLVGTCAWTLTRRGGNVLRLWPIALVATLTLFGMAGSFAPTPAFPQYYEPPIPFLIVLFILLHGELGRFDRASLRPMFLTIALLALAIIVPRLITTLPAAIKPSRWTGMVVHAQGQRIRHELAVRKLQGRVATLAPIVVLEGGLPIYGEFGAGPFVYRVADYLPAPDRRLFTTSSPAQLPQFLTANPPAAIVTGTEPALDAAFDSFARSNGFGRIDIDDGGLRLFVRRPGAVAVRSLMATR